MVEFIQCEALVEKIPDGSTIALTGFGGSSQSEKVLKGIRQRYLKRKTS